MDLTSSLTGLLTGLTLIIAIGAQNAFVLRQGILRRHVLAVVVVCAISDLLLILAGVAGLGALVTAHPIVLTVAKVLGAGFLLCYGLLSLRRARRPERLDAGQGRTASSTVAAIGTALALTWLNPHVYLDTVILLGSLAVTHGPSGRWWFGAGAATASLIWFFGLGYGARLLAPVFAKPRAWRVLDVAIGVLMLALAARLLLG